MGGRRLRGWLLVGLGVVVLLGGCAAGTTSSPESTVVVTATVPAAVATAVPIAKPAGTPTPGPTATARPASSQAPPAVVTLDVAYESANPLLAPGVLDVYAPARAGRWPAVVMFHGEGGNVSKGYLREHARRVADLGFVVFVPAWGQAPDGGGAPPTYNVLRAVNSQAACAIAFARAKAAAYGGDPSTMIVFGHSAGAERGAMVAFARPKPSAGCLGGTTLGAIDALITYEGDWLLAGPLGNVLDADPRILGVATPWRYLPGREDLTVVILVTSDPGVADRSLGDPKAADAFFARRDPSGMLREQLTAIGALADGSISFTENQQLLYAILKAQGNAVSLEVMPGSSHNYLSEAGWKVFVAAFAKAVAHH